MNKQEILLRIGELENEKYHLLSQLNMNTNTNTNMNANKNTNTNANANKGNMNYKLMFDGGSRGNPGLCGSGYVIYKDNEIIKEGHKMVSEENTNNYAEYMALILGLEYAVENNIQDLLILGDSKLVINQVNGIFQCKSENLVPLYNKVKTFLSKLKEYKCEHILRDKNKVADKLANIAMDNYIKE